MDGINHREGETEIGIGRGGMWQWTEAEEQRRGKKCKEERKKAEGVKEALRVEV